MIDRKTVDIPLHELPRDIRIWLCERVGWKTPVHFGVVSLFPESKTAAELKERMRAHPYFKTVDYMRSR